jgi:membrane-bound serine protease (ClpP class)
MNHEPLLYAVLLLVGLFLLGAEIYLPGGIVGFLGALALLGAAVVATQFPAPWNIFGVLLVLVLSAICIWLWIQFFPRSKMGKKLTLEADGSAFKAAETDAAIQTGCEGEALSALRPAGLALLNGQRVDVVAESSWIQAGARVKVIEVAGNRIVVRQLAPPKDAAK